MSNIGIGDFGYTSKHKSFLQLLGNASTIRPVFAPMGRPLSVYLSVELDTM